MSKHVCANVVLAVLGLMSLLSFADAATAVPNQIAHLSITSQNGQSLLVLHTTGQSMKLISRNQRGVNVVKLEPKDLFGLQVGDVIVAVNGHRVAGIPDLERSLHALNGAAASLQLQRGSVQVTVTLNADEYASLVAPMPPKTPDAPRPPEG